jgi:hypothetical protein
MITDELIKEKLSRKEARELLSLTRKTGIPGIPFIIRGDGTSIEEYFEQTKKNVEFYKEANISGLVLKRESAKLRCWELYQKVSDDHRDILIHWNIAWQSQQELKKSYKKMAKPAKQDNKTYHATRRDSDYSSNKNKIRYPRKARKTAWKRFYKLFPHLKPEES